MTETIGLVELDLQRRVTPDADGISVALLVVLTALPVCLAACYVVSDVRKVGVGTTRRCC
jgi:hypothetical protein